MIVCAVLLAGSFSQSVSGFPEYEYLTEWGSFGIVDAGHFSHPQFIAVDDEGSIYVSDLGNKRVQKFTSDGQYMTQWGKSGKLPGEFHYPSGIAVSDDHVFVADRNLNRVQKFTTDGDFVSQWGGKGIHEGQLYFPNGIAINNGTVYVVDTGNQRVQMFTTDGDFVSSFGSSGLGKGQFLTAVGIDIDDNGDVYVADRGNGKIEKFDADGEFLRSFSFYSQKYVFAPQAVTVDPAGKLFIVNSADERILHLSQDSEPRLNFFSQMGPYPNSFDIITDTAIGINGELLVVDSASHTIKSFETPFYTEPKVTEAPVIVSDQGNPVIIAPRSFEIDAYDLLTMISIGSATATDEDGISSITNNSTGVFSPGVTTIVWSAVDVNGYSSSAYQTVTVKVCGDAYSKYHVINGTQGDDVIQGTDGDDVIFGLAGNDLISGGLGDDCIFGGHGDDIILGGDGDDTIRGRSGNDILKGQSGADLIYAGAGFDVINGGEDIDRCYQDSGKDMLLNCES